jgi:hypothetical protein
VAYFKEIKRNIKKPHACMAAVRRSSRSGSSASGSSGGTLSRTPSLALYRTPSATAVDSDASSDSDNGSDSDGDNDSDADDDNDGLDADCDLSAIPPLSADEEDRAAMLSEVIRNALASRKTVRLCDGMYFF